MKKILITYGPSRASLDKNIFSTVMEIEECLVQMGYTVKRVGMRKKLKGFFREINSFRPHVIFNLCEAIEGDSTKEKAVAGLYEILGIPFTGNTSFTLGICQDKSFTKRILKSMSIPTPPFCVFSKQQNYQLPFAFPVIVKPVHEDGSCGISARSVVKNHDALTRRINYIIKKFKQDAIVEKFISGKELQVSVLGNNNPEILAIAEMSYHGLKRTLPRIVTYAAKWHVDSHYYKHTVPVIPARISKAVEEKIIEISKKIFAGFQLRGYARIDFRLIKEKPFVIDINPNPDISSDAGFAKAATFAGYTYKQLVGKIVELAEDKE